MKNAFIFSVIFIILIPDSYAQRQGKVSQNMPQPDLTDVKYGTHDRHRLDFWKAESDKPTPLVVYFHGGGFKNGDKTKIHQDIPVKQYLENGVSCASVNYPFLEHTGNDYIVIMKECGKAVDFILAQAHSWNIDTGKIASTGGSAGALIAEWLSCTTSNISVVGAFRQPWGTESLVLPFLRTGCPPIVIYQASPESDSIHHPKYATMLKNACSKKRIECVVWGTGKNGIQPPPGDKGTNGAMMQFFFDAWNMKIE